LEDKMKRNLLNYKRISDKKEVFKWACLLLPFPFFPFCLISWFLFSFQVNLLWRLKLLLLNKADTQSQQEKARNLHEDAMTRLTASYLQKEVTSTASLSCPIQCCLSFICLVTLFVLTFFVS
jgi:hypothetical protein